MHEDVYFALTRAVTAKLVFNEQLPNIFLDSRAEAREHGSTSGESNIAEETLLAINGAFANRLVD